MNYNLIEMRKRFLTMMSIHYGFMRPEDINIEAFFSAEELKTIEGKSFSASEALLATMTASLTKFNSAHAQGQFYIEFGDTISEARAPKAIATIPTTFMYEASATADAMRYPLAVKFDIDNILIAFSDEAQIACYTARALGVTAEIGELAIDAVAKDIRTHKLFATVGSALNFNAVVIPNREYRLEMDIDSALTAVAELVIDNQTKFTASINEHADMSAEVVSKALPKIVLGDLQVVVGMTASMHCERKARLYDYAQQTLNNTVGTLAELEYIIL